MSKSARILNVLRYSGIQLIAKGLSLFVLYTFAFLLSEEVYGYLTLFIAYILVATTFLGCNLQSVFLRYYYEYDLGHLFRLLKPLYLTLLCLSILISVGLLFFLFDSKQYKWFCSLPLYGFLAGSVLIVSILARCSGRWWLYAVAELSRPLSLLMALGVFFLATDANALALYSCFILVSALIVVMVGFAVYRGGQMGGGKNTSLSFPTVGRYLLPLFMMQIVALINGVADKYILNLYFPIEILGLYGKAYLMGSTFGTVVDSLVLLWAPYVVKNKPIFMRQIFPRTVVVFWCVLLLSCCLLILSVFFYVNSFAFFGVGTEFITVSTIVMAAFLIRVGYQIYMPVFSAFDLTKLVAKISVYSSLVGLVIALITIPYFNLYGAAASTWCAFATYSLLSFFQVSKYKKSDGMNYKIVG